jgi:sec-independent protein translocase protein TatB
MFDFGVGYSEMFVLALIALIVIGPKDLPKVLRTLGRFMQKARGMAREFQGHVDQAMRESGMDEVKGSLNDLKAPNLMTQQKVEAAPKDNSFKDYFGELESKTEPQAKP